MENFLSELIEMLKEVSPHLWEIAVKQARTEAIMNLVWGIVLLIAIVILGYILYRTTRYMREEGIDLIDDAGIFILVAISTLLITAFIIVCISDFDTALRYALNPEYYAIKTLLSLMTSK